MPTLIVGLAVALVLATSARAAAGEIVTGGISAFGTDVLVCTGVHLAGGQRAIRVSIHNSGGTELWFAQCNNLRPGGACQSVLDVPPPDNSFAPYTCRISGNDVLASKLRGTLFNRNTGASSDAR